MAAPAGRLALFERIEGAFSAQAKVSVALAGLTGFYMTDRLELWDRFLDPGAWWLHAMVAVWTLFALILYVAEPLFLNGWFREQAARTPGPAFPDTAERRQSPRGNRGVCGS